MTRFTYRVAEGPGEGRAHFQLAPQGYRFPAGHRIKVEVVANDAPYYQASNIPAVVDVHSLELVLPLLEPPGTTPTDDAGPDPAPDPAPAPTPDDAAPMPATGNRFGPTGLLLEALAFALATSGGRRPRHRRSGHRGRRGR